MRNDFFAYNSTSNEWEQVADFPGVKRKEPVSFVINNRAFVGTGLNNAREHLKDFWMYVPD